MMLHQLFMVIMLSFWEISNTVLKCFFLFFLSVPHWLVHLNSFLMQSRKKCPKQLLGWDSFNDKGISWKCLRKLFQNWSVLAFDVFFFVWHPGSQDTLIKDQDYLPLTTPWRQRDAVLGCDQTCQKISWSKGVGSLPNQFMLLSKPDQWCLVSQDHMALTFKCPPKWGESERESNFILCYLFLPNILTLILSQGGFYGKMNITVCDNFVFFPLSSLVERTFQFVFHF